MPAHGSASVHVDTEWDGFAVVVVWTTRGNYKADQRLDREALTRLSADCERVLAELDKEN
jgi:hypothetical protein